MNTRLVYLASIGIIGLLGCGDDGQPADGGTECLCLTDAGTPSDAGPVMCSPVANTGCMPGGKCTFVVESLDPLIGHHDCVPDGTVRWGESCERDEASGIDDCVGATWCDLEELVCVEVCWLEPDSCPDKLTCLRTKGLFEDENVGLCQ